MNLMLNYKSLNDIYDFYFIFLFMEDSCADKIKNTSCGFVILRDSLSSKFLSLSCKFRPMSRFLKEDLSKEKALILDFYIYQIDSTKTIILMENLNPHIEEYALKNDKNESIKFDIFQAFDIIKTLSVCFPDYSIRIDIFGIAKRIQKN